MTAAPRRALLWAAMATSAALGACVGAARPDATFEDFVGDWRGRLRLPDGRDVGMSLEVSPVDGDAERFHWRLRYEGQDVRDYTLIVRDRPAGEAELDENNGVVLPTTLRAGALISVFEVQGAVLNVRYRLERGALHFELESYRPDRGRPAGARVRAWPSVAVQRGLLRRR